MISIAKKGFTNSGLGSEKEEEPLSTIATYRKCWDFKGNFTVMKSESWWFKIWAADSAFSNALCIIPQTYSRLVVDQAHSLCCVTAIEQVFCLHLRSHVRQALLAPAQWVIFLRSKGGALGQHGWHFPQAVAFLHFLQNKVLINIKWAQYTALLFLKWLLL